MVLSSKVGRSAATTLAVTAGIAGLFNVKRCSRLALPPFTGRAASTASASPTRTHASASSVQLA